MFSRLGRKKDFIGQVSNGPDQKEMDLAQKKNTLGVVNREKGLQNIWSARSEMESCILSKEEYDKLVQKKRANFVHEHFGEIIKEAFQKLREAASKMHHCHHEVKFELPPHFDVDKTQDILRDYFKDLHYEAIAEPRKDDTDIIILTLT